MRYKINRITNGLRFHLDSFFKKKHITATSSFITKKVNFALETWDTWQFWLIHTCYIQAFWERKQN